MTTTEFRSNVRFETPPRFDPSTATAEQLKRVVECLQASIETEDGLTATLQDMGFAVPIKRKGELKAALQEVDDQLKRLAPQHDDVCKEMNTEGLRCFCDAWYYENS